MLIKKLATGVAVVFGASVLASGQAQAATATGLMPVTSLTVNACVVVATPLVFGTLNLISASPNDSTSVVTVTCTPGTAYNVGMDNGTHFSGGTRHMQAALSSALIPYGLFSDVTHATPWGATIGTNTVPGTATVLPTLLTVYGRVPGNTTPVAADAFSDLVTVTLTY